MLTQDEMLRKIVAQENKARSLGAKLWGQKAEVKTTLSLADRKEMPKYGDKSVIEPTPWVKIFLILFLGNFIYIGNRIYVDIPKESPWSELILIGLFSLLFLFLIIGIVRLYVLEKPLNSCIILNKNGIQVRKQLFKWEDILQTYIVTQPQNRGYTYWLVIGLHNGTINRYDLTQFMKIKEWVGIKELEVKLATAIEYYKKRKIISFES